jgi:2-polyprenyl-3-methyl-5-hydroxy-6-metoxy-1,4-benzoquinol methylase
MLITEEYKKLNAELHESNELYGTSGAKYGTFVADLMNRANTTDLLDYGCGKCTLAKGLEGCSVRGYDPAIPEYSALPEPADVVSCTDVLEHIEPELLDNVLAHIESLTNKAAFLVASTVPAMKILADGRNAHLIVQSGQWWFNKISEYFTIKSYNHMSSEVWFICQKK